MHFWKGAKYAGSVGHPMTKMRSASGGLRPPEAERILVIGCPTEPANLASDREICFVTVHWC